ncbi:MAG: CDP-2,3-bis-(O-geranylgeranyl)-sn-glycerol synthase [Candidatus Bathyarchaeota archaeon]
MIELTEPTFILMISLILVPAYVANGMAPVFGGGKPIDLGKNFIDGKRILGDGKTIRGAVSGIVFGTFAILVEVALVNVLVIDVFLNSTFILFGLVIALGAIIGDLIGAFIKRRLGLARGKSVPGLDQLTFILIAFIFAYGFTQFIPLTIITFTMLLVALIITPFLHLLGNYVGYKIGKKREPW